MTQQSFLALMCESSKGQNAHTNGHTVTRQEEKQSAEPMQSLTQNLAKPTTLAESNVESVESGVFTVLETRPSKPGTVRAYCQDNNGGKVAIYANNGNGEHLSAAVGRAVQVNFRRVDKGLYALKVKNA